MTLFLQIAGVGLTALIGALGGGLVSALLRPPQLGTWGGLIAGGVAGLLGGIALFSFGGGFSGVEALSSSQLMAHLVAGGVAGMIFTFTLGRALAMVQRAPAPLSRQQERPQKRTMDPAHPDTEGKPRHERDRSAAHAPLGEGVVGATDHDETDKAAGR